MTASTFADIAVVIPALNAARTLRRAFDSLAGQCAGCEIVLVDGGSRDGTREIAAALPWVRVVSAPGTSIYEAINRGIAETAAPAIVLVNADDMVLPGALAAWRAALAGAPHTGIARGLPEFLAEDATGSLAPLRRVDRRDLQTLNLDLLLRGPCAINSLCIRRDVFGRIGAFDTNFRLAADRDWMIRAWLANIRIVESGTPVYRYVAHEGSQTLDPARRNFALIRSEHLAIAERYLAADRLPGDFSAAVRRWHAAETAMLSLHQMRTLEWRGLGNTVSRAFRVAPRWPLTSMREFAVWLRSRR